ncbi:MAG: magnesium transporter [Chloroflexi bacterium]|nr:magnesium transporter [Chloroflexota bacterium]
MKERAILLDMLVDRVRSLLSEERYEEAAMLLEGLHPADVAEIFEELDEDEQTLLLQHMDPGVSADVLEELHEEEAAELAEELPDDMLTAIVDEMEPDEAADLLREMPEERRQRILAELEDPDEVRPLLRHPDESAGGLMTTEFLALRRRMTVADALEAVRQLAPSADPDNIFYIYVVDQYGRLVGVVSLYDLIRAEPYELIGDVMDRDVISVRSDVDREEAAAVFAHYDLLSLPVVDEDGRLVGIITSDDILDVLEEEATEDIQRLGGSEPLDKPYLDTSPFEVMRKRVGWLLLLFVTASLTGTVMKLFQGDLSRHIELTYFIPLLIGTGGNAGSQTTATIIRALAIGEVDLRDALSVLWHEMRVGLLLGLVMALVGVLRALTWGTPFPVAEAVATALILLILWATSVGAVMPLIMSRLGIDPAVVSGPFMSTLVDATGLFIYLQTARLILG